jgi:hypothetical protein
MTGGENELERRIDCLFSRRFATNVDSQIAALRGQVARLDSKIGR